MNKPKILFVCQSQYPRSRTAEMLFFGESDALPRSAGITKDCENPISHPRVRWAEKVFAMEEKDAEVIRNQFGKSLKDKPLIVLNIPDKFHYFEPALLKLLRERVFPHIA